MNLEETIKHCEEVAYEQDMKAGFETDNQTYTMSEAERESCKECASEHRHLAKLLTELKQLREQTRWTPVDSGKLPKFGEKVLVHITKIDGIEYDVACLKDTKHAAYDGDYYWEGKFAYGLKNVIEWKPIEGSESK